jgi:hypothetical protein
MWVGDQRFWGSVARMAPVGQMSVQFLHPMGAPVHIDKQDIVSGAGLWRFGIVGDFSIFLLQCSPSLMYDECPHEI